MKAINLKTCGMSTPLGIDISRPRFTWTCSGGLRQTTWRLTAYTEDGESVYDSGQQNGAKMYCLYGGRPLKSRERIFWSVCLWDEDCQPCMSDMSWFETGLLTADDWSAKWICGVGTNVRKRLPADYYRIDFTSSGAIRKARLYATACGVYSAHINGVRISTVLPPGCSEYEKHLYYQTYDISELIRTQNTLVFCVADGWYKGKVGSDNCEYLHGTQTKLFAQLEVTYEDGTVQTVATSPDFLWCSNGPVRAADLKDGEIYDSRMTPTFDQHALTADFHRIPVASNAPLITEHETFTPSLEQTPSGKILLNFHQNIAGYIRFRAKGETGKKITLSMFEVTDHGEYSDITINGRCSNLQRIEYICNGSEEIFQPEFFYSGFQYALVEGTDEINPEDFESVAVYSNLDYNSSFRCSDPMLNRFVSNTLWS